MAGVSAVATAAPASGELAGVGVATTGSAGTFGVGSTTSFDLASSLVAQEASKRHIATAWGNRFMH